MFALANILERYKSYQVFFTSENGRSWKEGGNNVEIQDDLDNVTSQDGECGNEEMKADLNDVSYKLKDAQKFKETAVLMAVESAAKLTENWLQKQLINALIVWSLAR